MHMSSKRPSWPWPTEMDRIAAVAEHDPILRALLTVGAARGLPSLTVLSLAWNETLRSARRHVADIEQLTQQRWPAARAMLDYLTRQWRTAAVENTPYIRRRRHWRVVAVTRIGLLCAAAQERRDLCRILNRAYELYARPAAFTRS